VAGDCLGVRRDQLRLLLPRRAELRNLSSSLRQRCRDTPVCFADSRRYGLGTRHSSASRWGDRPENLFNIPLWHLSPPAPVGPAISGRHLPSLLPFRCCPASPAAAAQKTLRAIPRFHRLSKNADTLPRGPAYA